MEISIGYSVKYQNNEFKIDLIVWKFCRCLLIATIIIKFKIDLIVWKLAIPCVNNNAIKPFKIDLIVWKFVMKNLLSVLVKSLK